jgi:hypothetical protein
VKPCRPRHRYRGELHAAGCDAERWVHWHVICRRCRFAWMQVMFFDPRPFEVAA